MNITASNGVMNLGHQLDNLATVISFPIGDIVADQGAGGSWSVRIQRNGDVAAYPSSNFSISNNNLNLIMTSSDLANVGEGQIQLKYAVGSKVLMSRVYKFYSHYSLDGSGTVPAPWQSWVDAVEADADRAEEAVAHYPYVDTTTKHWMQWDVEDEQFVDTGIVAEGQDGEDGEDGVDGTTFTPAVSAEGVISWTNDGGKPNPTPVNIKGPAGQDGEDGEDGEDGFSPSASVSKSGSVATITITDKDGTTTAQVSDGITQDLSAYRTSAAQDVIDATLQPKTDNLLSTNDKTVVGGMNEINSIAKGATQAVSYGNISTMVTALNAMASTQYRTGQNIYIVTLDVPDLWVSSVEQSSVPYTYVDDATFVNALVTNGYVQVGYYKLSAMETNKVDLSNYYTKSQTDTALANKVAKTDYATGSVGGVVKTYPSYFGTDCGSTGFFYGSGFNMTQYASASNVALISKQTLENVLDNESIRIDKTQSLSSAQKSQVYSNLGAVSSQGIPIATSISSSSTHNEVVSAKAVYDFVMSLMG